MYEEESLQIREDFFMALGWKRVGVPMYGNNFEVPYRWYPPKGAECFDLPPVDQEVSEFNKWVLPEMEKRGLSACGFGRIQGWKYNQDDEYYHDCSGHDIFAPKGILEKLTVSATRIIVGESIGRRVEQ